MESTIRNYENSETSVLQDLLKKYELESEECELLKEERISNNQNYIDLQTIIDDYEIDISLLRMELNKRIWKEK